MTGNLIVRSSLSVLLAALGVSAVGQDLNIESIRTQVRENMEQVDSLWVIVRQWRPDDTTQRHEWAFTESGEIRHARTRDYTELPDLQSDGGFPIFVEQAFDGKEGRWLQWSESGEQHSGKIHTEQQTERSLRARAPARTKFGRALGVLVAQNKSLSEWLDMPAAEFAGYESINGVRCAVVSVLDEEALMRLQAYLSVDHGFALLRYDFEVILGADPDARTGFTVEVENLTEAEPGLWVPAEGVYRTTPPPGESPHSVYFEVEAIEVNSPLPSELFEIEFEPGVTVTDHEEG